MEISLNRARIAIQRSLDTYSDNYYNAMDKLSTGSKYASRSENPVEFAMSAELKRSISVNNSITDYISQGNDMLTIAEGAEETVSDTLQSIRDLCLQAANGSYTDSDKDKILTDIRGKLESINATAASTKFAGKNLLDGTCTTLPIQISASAGDSVDVAKAFVSVKTSDLDVDIPSTVTGATWTIDDIHAYMDKVDLAQTSLRDSVTSIGAYSTRLDAASDKLNKVNTNLTELNSYVSDADIAEVSAQMVQQQILQQTSVTILTHTNNMASNLFSLLSGK